MEYGLRFSDPAKCSRALRCARELVVSGIPHPEIHNDLAHSWHRSMPLGISPDQHSPRHPNDVSDVLELRRADRPEFSAGADWSAAWIGTNAISEALVTSRPGQLFSAEHLVRTHHEWACTAAPISDPATGRLLGVLDISGSLNTLSADALRMVRCAVRVAESLLGTSAGGTALSAASPVRASWQPARQPVASVESLELLGDRPAAVLPRRSQPASPAPTGPR